MWMPDRVPRQGTAPKRSCRGLRDLGYAEGKNIVIEYRWADGKLDRVPGFVAELVHVKVDVIVSSATPAIRFAKEQTATIPSSWQASPIPSPTGLLAVWHTQEET